MFEGILREFPLRILNLSLYLRKTEFKFEIVSEFDFETEFEFFFVKTSPEDQNDQKQAFTVC